MRSLRAWLVRAVSFIRSRRGERDFLEELQSHVNLHIDDNLRAGMAPDRSGGRRAAHGIDAGRGNSGAPLLRAAPVATLRCD